MERTQNLNLPLMKPAQTGKHIVVNESLAALDAAAQTRLSGVDINTPPTTRTAGQTYAAGLNPVDEWAAHPHCLAIDLVTDWRFIPLRPGVRAVNLSDLSLILWTGTEWRPEIDMSESQQFNTLGVGAVAAPGQTLTIEGASALLSAGTDDFRLSVDCNGSADVSSVLWQTNFVTKPEMGLLESEQLTIRTYGSSDQTHDNLSASADVAGIECPAYRSILISTVDQEVRSVVPPQNSGIVMICSSDPVYPQANHSGIFAYDTGLSLVLRVLAIDSEL